MRSNKQAACLGVCRGIGTPFAVIEQWDIERQRVALKRIAAEFAEVMARRSPTAYAGELRVNRF
ncbi:hypothetical protein [Burkholderia sp. PU8-34]